MKFTITAVVAALAAAVIAAPAPSENSVAVRVPHGSLEDTIATLRSEKKHKRGTDEDSYIIVVGWD